MEFEKLNELEPDSEMIRIDQVVEVSLNYLVGLINDHEAERDDR